MRAHRYWYRYGLRSPLVLWARFRNAHHPVLAVRTGYQRARYGIADSDAWSLDHFLAVTTVRGVRKLRGWATGHPVGLTAEEWDGILGQIEDGFQAWLDSDGWFTDDPDSALRFATGMELYGKWFGALWD